MARARRLVAVLAVLYGLAEVAMTLTRRLALHPFTSVGWVREHVAVGVLVALLGALALARRPRLASLALTALALVSWLVYARWFALPLGLLALAVPLAMIAAAESRWLRAAWLVWLVAPTIFVAASLARPGAVRGRQPLPSQPITDAARRAAFDHFAVETTLSSGVTPKRYFGFVDEAGDTAVYESVLRQTVRRAAALCNQDAARRGHSVRVSEKEIAVTFLAEGGALVLSNPQHAIERIHPIYGIGLDDFRDGFARHPALVAALDEALGTGLGRLTWSLGRWRPIARPMTFREAIAGTALMYLDEKERAARLLSARDHTELSSLPLDRQFVITSLVYNSGILFSDARVDQILAFDTAAHLAEIDAKRGARPPLPIAPAAELRRRVEQHEPLPPQPTSWSAVYHVLQRYGAWTALERFSDAFDAEGQFRRVD